MCVRERERVSVSVSVSVCLSVCVSVRVCGSVSVCVQEWVRVCARQKASAPEFLFARSFGSDHACWGGGKGDQSGDTTPCKATPVILHGVVSTYRSDCTQYLARLVFKARRLLYHSTLGRE